MAAGLLEGVGHWGPPWVGVSYCLNNKEREGILQPLHKTNTLVFLDKKLKHHKIIKVRLTHEVTKVHRLKFAVEHNGAAQVEKQETDVIKSVQRISHR